MPHRQGKHEQEVTRMSCRPLRERLHCFRLRRWGVIRTMNWKSRWIRSGWFEAESGAMHSGQWVEFEIDRRRPLNRRIAKKLPLWSLLFVLIFASSYRQRYPAQTQIVDRGTFALRQAGYLIGQETFTLRASFGGGYRLTSTTELDIGAEQPLQLDQDLHLDRQWRPRQGQWRLRSGGVLGQASVEVQGHRAQLEVRLGSQQREREVQSDLDFVVVPSNVLSHLLIVHQILMESEENGAASVRQFTGLDPWSLTAPIFEVQRVEPLQVEIDAAGGVERANRFLAVLGPWNVELFVQGDHLIGWRLPYQRAFIYRSDLFPSGFNIDKGPRPDLQVPLGSEEREHRFPGYDGVSLAGTLMLPAKTGSGSPPAVLLIAGSGPIDRDGNAPGVSFDVQKALAYHLARNGVASFRYDKRGTGASDGDWRRASFRDLIEDARAALQWLREQPEVGPIFLFGHSEGAEIAPILAMEEPVAGLMVIAGPARPLDQLLLWQTEWLHRAQGFTESEIQAAVEREEQLLDFIRRSQGEWDDYTLEDLQEELPWLTASEFQALKNSFALSWYRQHFQHDPLETMRRVRVPVLLLHGEKDVQVPPEDARHLAQALAEAGHEAFRLNMMSDMDHLLRWHPERACLGYAHLDEPVDARVGEAVIDWLMDRGTSGR